MSSVPAFYSPTANLEWPKLGDLRWSHQSQQAQPGTDVAYTVNSLPSTYVLSQYC